MDQACRAEIFRLTSALYRVLLHRFPVCVRSNIVADEPTRSGTVYPKAVLEKAIASANERAARGTFFGMLEGADANAGNRTLLSKVSHQWKPRFRLEGNRLVGEAEILDTEEGRKIAPFLTSPNLRIAPRGIGSVEVRGGVRVVQSDYLATAFDLALDESPELPGYGISSRGTKS